MISLPAQMLKRILKFLVVCLLAVVIVMIALVPMEFF